MAIKVMSDKLANQIAAGEVVEKTYNVVKELVENSLDAAASEIIIDLIDSGLTKITVIDNGIGMNKEDAILSVYRHATSKILNEEDLWNIATLGFRGEALASIGSVSHLNITTSDGNVGTTIFVKGGDLPKVSKAPLRKGTKVEVAKLFFNTPARYKFLKNPHYELAVITNYINKMALARPDVSFTLINNGNLLLKTIGDNDLLRVLGEIYGPSITKKMLKLEASNNDYKVYGYVGLPETQKSTINAITTIVNGRLIRNNDINKLITKIYSFYIPDSKYPMVVLNIEVDPSLIDVNIHPTKMDIKFSKLNELKDLLETNIKNLISQKSLIPKIENINFETYDNAETLSFDLDDTLNEIEAKGVEKLNVRTILFKTYILCDDYKALYLIDQHAAAERINFEKNLKALKSNIKQKVKLLVPVELELSSDEKLAFEKEKQNLEDLGFEFDEFGDAYIIRSHPSWVKADDAFYEVKRILDIFINKEKFDLDEFNDHLAATMACKRSIKANDYLNLEQAQELVDQLLRCENPYNCPHGRPTIISFTKFELEKMFMRIMY